MRSDRSSGLGTGSLGLTETSLRTLSGDPLMEEARRRFDRCAEWEATARKKFLEDLKFANADAYNGYQWPDDIRRTRDLTDKPCLTMNVTRQHNLMIANEARRNKSSPRVLGVGNGATQESANVVKDLIRHIEYISTAQTAYTVGREFQVAGGIGWWRIITDYESNDSFDQEIFIAPVLDPLSVYLDPDIQKPDGSDAEFAFVFDFLPEDLAAEYLPNWTPGTAPKTPFGLATGESFWVEKDHVIVCEYFRKVPKKDTLISFMTPSGERRNVKASQLPADVRQKLLEDDKTYSRDFIEKEVEWKLIIGEEVVDETTWMGNYIPLIRCIGEETQIEGILDRKGHTRAMLDPQRMFNYNASGQVEFGALQTKTPWIASAKAIEEHETMWNSANTENHSVLIFNDTDEDNPDRTIVPPMRTDPPVPAPVFEAGMQAAMQQMMLASGQHQNQMGMLGNERTGRAIEDRQEQGDTATYHYQDNYASSLRYTYQQIIDLIPKIYDTRRVKTILADDGVEYEVVIDPQAQQTYLQEMDHQNLVVKRVLNPQLGKYFVAADVGPETKTKRRETVDALTLILTQAPALTGIIGDLLLKSMDFEEAQEAALRLKRMVPPIALGQGPTQREQALTQQVGQLTTTLSKAMQRHGKDALKLVGKDQMRDIDVYEAETGRMQALAKMLPTDSEGLSALIQQLVEDALATHLTPILKANIPGLTEQSASGDTGNGASTGSEAPPMPGAQKAPDGEWYLLDPTRQGRYLRVRPLAQERSTRGIVANA